MIVLASSSQTRAEILRNANVEFRQISFSFAENVSKNLPPEKYVLEVVLSKKAQFLDVYKDLDNILFADSIVRVGNQILTKAINRNEAKSMLLAQSGNKVGVLSAMIFVSKKFSLTSMNETIYEFENFNQDDLDDYLKSEQWRDKAGAMMIEGFNKKYIKSQKGSTNNARGLDVEILKAFL